MLQSSRLFALVLLLLFSKLALAAECGTTQAVLDGDMAGFSFETPSTAPAANTSCSSSGLGNGPANAFSEVIEKLGGRSNGDQCRRTQDELARIETEEYKDWDRRKLDAQGEDWACVMLKRHLERDSRGECLKDPKQVFEAPVTSAMDIRGKVSFMGWISLPYRYAIEPGPEGTVIIKVRLRFKGEAGRDPELLESMRKKLAEAEEIWSKQSPGGRLQFRFPIVGEQETADFEPELIREDRKKPVSMKYDSKWGSESFSNQIAHELGHAMGLDDEYSIIRSVIWKVRNPADTLQCNIRGIMCNVYETSPKIPPYLYYLILRRQFCR